ncbi:lysophospholipid acyltransferase family protein [Qipengyuania qiaonensis]|uniref:Lysophospholipid acyltransferase family protein n=1 Tax=Qipengyuania qiaonensis TaxID=2867240 RepID=A0ABS7J3G0_9SPHN|nr:lysophospholipid acyltransferase family protein [Qipengyuania qiaonensis]MBX7481865.1 lysophospholipid acyltransferase family protein [Qipengyuania qiaonensis]
MPTDANRRPSLPSRLVRRILIALYRWKGWKLEGRKPDCDKFVLLGAPHTSNWDFVFFLGATRELGIKPSFMGKASLFKWPMTDFMLDMGGLPVDRSKRGNYVDQVVQAFASTDELALVIAPEGSRTFAGSWRTGFYHIAMAAGVPIVPAWVNNATMRGGIGEPIMPTGDYRADLARIAAFYRRKRPDCDRFVALEKSAQTLEEMKGDS